MARTFRWAILDRDQSLVRQVISLQFQETGVARLGPLDWSAGHFLTENAVIYLGTLGNRPRFWRHHPEPSLRMYFQPQLNRFRVFIGKYSPDGFHPDDADASAWNTGGMQRDESIANVQCEP